MSVPSLNSTAPHSSSPSSSGLSVKPGLPIAPDKPWLAPLAGYSDLPFRLLCREQGAAVTVTEMVSAKGLFYNSKASMALLASYPDSRTSTAISENPTPWHFPEESPFCAAGLKSPSDFSATISPPCPTNNPADDPLVVQLFGGEASYMGRAVAFLRDQGYQWFDCNMGCSVAKVVKSGAGAALLKDVDNALLIAKAMLSEAGPGRVGFKIRLGWEAGAETYLSLALALEELGAGWITLHPRCSRQGFSGQANWSALSKLKKRLSIPLMASGDLLSAKAGKACLEQTGVDGLMFARGAMQDPAIFSKLLHLLTATPADASNNSAEQKPSPQDSKQELADIKSIIRRHAALARAFTPTVDSALSSRTALLKMRTFVPRYVRNFNGVRELRQQLTKLTTWQELEDILESL